MPTHGKFGCEGVILDTSDLVNCDDVIAGALRYPPINLEISASPSRKLAFKLFKLSAGFTCLFLVYGTKLIESPQTVISTIIN
jgi:uncharacterized protein (DUF362 family)